MTSQKKALLKAKIALSLQDTLGRQPTELEIERYTFSHPVSLLIRSASPIFDVSSFEKYIERGEIQAPGNMFQDIWLLVRDDERPGWPHLLCP